MNLEVDIERLLLAHKSVRAELLAERAAGGQWTGHVASSPLATAAAISALVMAHSTDCKTVLREGNAGDGSVIEQLVQCDLSELLVECLHWLARHQNPDGGWGDCEGAQSNIAATMMVQAGFRLTGIPAKYADLMVRADDYVEAEGGVAGFRRQHGRDKTLVAAVLVNCALAGMVPWRQVPVLRYERACVPKRWQYRIQLPLAREARPLFIAAGLAKLHHDPPHNPFTRLLRKSLRAKSLAIIERVQAADDSFLASPAYTAFVVTSLASIGCQEHSIVRRGIEFLLTTVRADSSWPVAVNLATTNTTNSLSSLISEFAEAPAITSAAIWNERSDAWEEDTASAGETVSEDVVRPISHPGRAHALPHLGEHEFDTSMKWLLDCQRTERDALTDVPAGGWASSDSPGAPMNTIDTAGVLVALSRWRLQNDDLRRDRLDRAVKRGISWLLELQTDEGGWPTFYREGNSARSRVSPTLGMRVSEKLAYVDADECDIDATAKAIQALAAWRSRDTVSDERVTSAIDAGMQYLQAQQREDGSFVPRWFGNEYQPDDQNPVIGTAQVLTACATTGTLHTQMAERAARWLLSAQHSSSGWGPPRTKADYSGAEKEGFRARRTNEAMAKFCSVEETAAAVASLLPLVGESEEFSQACARGLTWLINAMEQDAHRRPAVVGFYPSKIWYHERLYPLAFASQALTRATRQLAEVRPATVPVGSGRLQGRRGG